MKFTANQQKVYKRVLNNIPESLVKLFLRIGFLDSSKTMLALAGTRKFADVAGYLRVVLKRPLYRDIFPYSSLRALDQPYVLRQTVTENVISLILSGKLDHADCGNLDNVSSVLNLLGFFRASALMRLKAIESSLKRPHDAASPSELIARLELSMVAPAIQTQVEGTGQYMSECGELFIETGPTDFKMLLNVLHQHSASKVNANEHAKGARTNESAAIRNPERTEEVVKGKKILFIGPSKRLTEDDPSVSFDSSIRIGYSGEDSLASKKDIAPDISFYRPHKLAALRRRGSLNILSSLKLAYLGSAGAIPKIPRSLMKHVHLSPFRGRILNGDEPNAGTEALLCLLGDGAAHVHITNLDLFINKVRPGGYIADGPKNDESEDAWAVDDFDFSRSLALFHNPLPQYAVFRTAWSQGLVSGDREFEKIMEDGLMFYLLRLESEYEPLRALSRQKP